MRTSGGNAAQKVRMKEEDLVVSKRQSGSQSTKSLVQPYQVREAERL